jgi:DNA-binding transcriptional LysR family regulator
LTVLTVSWVGFERSHTGVTPTPLGRYAVERARAILVDVDHLAATVSAMTAVGPSSVRLGGFPSAPVSGIANRLRRHGDIEQVSIEVEWSSSVLLQQLDSGRLDFAILREFPGYELRMPARVQQRTIVEREAAIVAMAHDHRLARETTAGD